MKQLISIFFLSLALAVSAGVQYTPTSPTDGIIRVGSEDSILLLPIAESAPECRLQIISHGTILRTVILRLATESVDYRLPLDLREIDHAGLVLAIHGAQSIGWKQAQWVTDYDATCVCGQRPMFHHAPPYGWMNDPNGMYYDETTHLWHLFYQWNPYCATWQNMSWGHSVSKDLIHWEACPVAITPNTLGTIFSGSAVIDHHNSAGFGRDAVVAVYTQAELLGQVQSIAVSNDHGQTFIPYEDNPVLTANVSDFRDPKVFWDTIRNAWTMVLVAGQEAQFYSSPNLKQWTLLSSFGTNYGCHDGVWECPDLFPLPLRDSQTQKWVLLININPGGPFGGSATQYFVGEWDGYAFHCDQKDTRWLDMGKDHYAAVTFANAPDNRRVLLAWMSNWQYANQVPTIGFRSANTLPRELDLYKDEQNTYRVGVHPAKEVAAVHGERTKSLPPTAVIEMEMTTNKRNATLTLYNHLGEEVILTLDANQRTFSMDRTRSGKIEFSSDFSAITSTPLYGNKKKSHLTIYVDYHSIEVFDGDGYWSMTNLVFPTMPYTYIKAEYCKYKIYSINN